MPTSFPPPPPDRGAPAPDDVPARRSWGNVARWKRWLVYWVAICIALGGVGAAIAEPSGTDDDPAPAPARPSRSATTSPELIADVPATTSAPTAHDVGTRTDHDRARDGSRRRAAGDRVPRRPNRRRPNHRPTAAPETVPGSALALDVLAMIPVEREQPAGYERDLFHYGDTVDDHGCRTRALVLMRDSLTPAQVDAGGCAVIAGDWYSRYDGLTWSDPAELEIDHVVALKEAWDSGAWAWDDARLTAYGNDVDEVRSLVAVTGAENQAKSDKDPSNWIPSNADAVCTYLADWTSIKARWGLSMDESEHGRIRNLLTDRCPGQTIAPWAPVPVTVAPAPAPAPAPVPAPPLAAVPASDCDPSYPTLCIPVGAPDLDCGDIPDRRFPVQPPDPHRFDGNHDGVGCES